MKRADLIPIPALILICAAMPAFGQEDHAPEPAVLVDLASDQGPVTYAASGFLHGLSFSEPPDAVIEPLKPRLFRNAAKGALGAFESYERIKRFGARSQIVISDSYGYKGGYPGDDNDYKRLEQIIYSLIEQSRRHNQRHEWDIWNEPDLKHFWPRPREQFFGTWKRAVRLLRSLDATAVIVGPSYNRFNPSELKQFLSFARDENVLPDIFSWHEIPPDGVPDVSGHIREMREWMKENKIEIERIQINEHSGKNMMFQPGAAVWMLAQLESEKVDGAAKACWHEKGKSNCQSATLGGLLTLGTREPRAVWWAYKGYANITGRLVSVKPTADLHGIAGFDAYQGKLTALFGSKKREAGPASFHFQGIRRAFPDIKSAAVRVHAFLIPFKGDGRAALALPEVSIDAVYQIEDDSVRVTLPYLGSDDACVIEIMANEFTAAS